LGTDNISWSGDGSRVVDVVGVLPGSGRSLIDVAARRCQALITGDVGYHDAQRADEAGLSIISVPHGEFEWWALRHWAGDLATILQKEGVSVAVSQDYSPAWGYVGGGTSNADEHAGSMKAGSPTHAASPAVRLWIDGGSRGNPGPSAIGVVVEDVDGEVIDNIARFIGTTTNNVAEYRALLAGLEAAAFLGASEVEVVSDSELLVKQMRGEYKVKNEGLKPLHAQAMAEAAAITSFVIRHVEREQNTRADALVNRALDEEEGAGL
jgi:ribonuclease HI